MRPVIGYATRSLAPLDDGTPARFGVNQSYARAIADHGGAPVMIPSLADDAVLDSLYPLLDGLLIPGGPDIDPSYYAATERHATVEVDDALDRTEAYLVRRALDDDLPILGICRGVQVLNVIAGGTLYQDLPSYWTSTTDHAVYHLGRHHTPHTIEIVPGTRLAHVLDRREVEPLPVNTLHHQAVRDLAPGFQVNAHADDGLVEGIEHPGRAFAIGVQCHPEELYTRTHGWDRLFSAFVKAAAERASARANALPQAVLSPR